MSYSIVSVRDDRGREQVNRLLAQEGIRPDAHLDYTCAMLDDSDHIAATGSCFGNTLRCIAISAEHQGEGLLGPLLTHLTQVQYQRGNCHLFLYTKCQTAPFFRDLGFFEIARVKDTLAFMENRKSGFPGYLAKLAGTRREGRSAAIVMNANPFTLGHQYLIERAAAENDTVHVFVLSEDVSAFPFPVRWRLVREGTAHLPNVICHESGPYIISSATFPSYFFKDKASVIEGHARLDLAVFSQIAQALNITARYVGEEPSSMVTGRYNQLMAEELPKRGIECVIIPRKEAEGVPISASTVRTCLKNGDLRMLRKLVPPTTFEFLSSAEAAPIIRRIQAAKNVVHY